MHGVCGGAALRAKNAAASRRASRAAKPGRGTGPGGLSASDRRGAVAVAGAALLRRLHLGRCPGSRETAQVPPGPRRFRRRGGPACHWSLQPKGLSAGSESPSLGCRGWSGTRPPGGGLTPKAHPVADGRNFLSAVAVAVGDVSDCTAVRRGWTGCGGPGCALDALLACGHCRQGVSVMGHRGRSHRCRVRIVPPERRTGSPAGGAERPLAVRLPAAP